MHAELARQLNAVSLLANRVAVDPGASRKAAYAELMQRAAAYASIGSNVILPALRGANWKDVRSDLLTASARFQNTLAELLVVDPDDAAFTDTLQRFRHAVADLTAANRHQLEPALRAAGLEQDPLALDRVMQAFQLPARDAPFDLSGAVQLVQDAALVLSSIRFERRRVPRVPARDR